jgi:hypothetical protein
MRNKSAVEKFRRLRNELNISSELNKSLIVDDTDEISLLIINNINKFDFGIYTCTLKILLK